MPRGATRRVRIVELPKVSIRDMAEQPSKPFAPLPVREIECPVLNESAGRVTVVMPDGSRMDVPA